MDYLSDECNLPDQFADQVNISFQCGSVDAAVVGFRCFIHVEDIVSIG